MPRTPPLTHRFPNGIVVDGVETSKASAQPAATADEDDFFSSWDKPASSNPKAVEPPQRAAPPSIGRASSAPAPRTITSSSLRANSASAGGGARTLTSTSTSSTGTGTGARPAKKGLGAKKAAPVDFAEAERRAAAEVERIRQLGYDREREEAEAEAAREAAALELKNKSVATTVSAGSSSADVGRLEAGVKKLGFGALPRAQPATAPKACVCSLRYPAGAAELTDVIQHFPVVV